MEVGGKTGTGDHRKEVWGPGGRLLESKFISRAAVFTFFLGEQYFGVITAYVTGDDAGRYHFTSSLPVQILKTLKPTLSPLLNKTGVIEPEPNPNPLPTLQTVKLTPLVKPAALPTIKQPIASNALPPAKPLPQKLMVEMVKATVKKPPTVTVTKPRPVENMVKPVRQLPVANPLKASKLLPPANPVKPIPKDATVKPLSPVSKPLALTPNPTPSTSNKPKPVVKAVVVPVKPTTPTAKVSVDDKKNSATRYYKYPTVTPQPQPVPTQPVAR
jgi:hypothetical protein